ncbi:MAG: hypothetical protein JWP01_3056 [Myxococcales bacterium]|nr:hypothetical protein [Myxococcales bacterium]
MLAAALLVALQVASVTDVANPRAAGGWVTDQASVVSADSEARIDAIANELYQLRGIELAVVTVDSVPGTPKQFATELFNHWKIGSAATNNGVLVLLVMSQRRLEIETGDGMDAALPSQWLADMQASSMVPRFKHKDFGGGLVAAVEAIAAHVKAAPGEGTTTQAPHEYRSNGEVTTPDSPRSTTTATTTTNTSPPMEYGTDTGAGPSTGALVGGSLGLLGVGGGGAALMLRRRRKQRTCSTCEPARTMLPLSEIEDDQHLEAGQIAEERVGSVDYEVVVCPGCQLTRTLRHGTWFSGYSRCSGCLFKTMKSTSTTLVHATYDHGGRVQVTESCSNCSHVVSYTRTTAARTRPSTTSSSSRGSSFSSSSGGSSFGGGRSSGGGAGSSW